MDRVLSATQGTFTDTSEAPSSICLLKRGLEFFRQGRYIEGASLCMLAREELPPHQEHLAPVIDSILASHARYWQAQEAFHQASRCFVEAEAEQQTLLSTAERLLSAPLWEPDVTPQLHAPAKAPGSLQGLQLLPSPHISRAHSNGKQSPAENGALPALYITCFGRFEAKRLGQTIAHCHNRNGQAILRYLLAQPGYRATLDTLMAVLWPEDEADATRHKVQVAVSALRSTLNAGFACQAGAGYILCKNGVYQLNPAVSYTTDVDEFLLLYQAGRQSETAIAAYERACQLYTGPFLAEDLYADWSFARREQLCQCFLTMCHTLADYYLAAGRYEEAAKWASAILKENRSDEDAHRHLMRIYTAQGRRSEALRQYQRCERILAEDLGVPPMPETVNILRAILTHEGVPGAVTRIEQK